MPASEGDKFIYAHPENKGYGEDARGEPLSAEMTELDLQDGMAVSFLEYDDAGWALVEWVDNKGIDRITAIDPEVFSYFIPEAGRNDL
jgi:hypothetical protein